MLRLALIGCGWHSEAAHASPLAHYVRQHPGEVELAGVCDLRAERAALFCRQYGFARAYEDIEEMLEAERPEVVVSILPIERIVAVGSLLLQRRIPCVLEKPPGDSLAEAEALAAIARQTGTPHMVSLNRRFNPYLNRAREWARTIGPLRYIRGQMLRHGRREDDFLWGTGVHGVDAMRHLGGEVASFALQALEPSDGATPWLVLSLRFASGAVGHLEILPTVGMVEERFELYGDDFRACAVTTGGAGESVRGWRAGTLEIEETAPAETPVFLRDGSYEEACAFIRGVREGGALHPTLEEVLPSLTICAQRAPIP